jgi:hypothetical protein
MRLRAHARSGNLPPTMTADQYLQNILVHDAVDTDIFEKTL